MINDHVMLTSSLLLWRLDCDIGTSTSIRAMFARSDKQGPTSSFFSQYWAGTGQVLKKSWVAGGYRSGRSVEIFDRVFLGNLFTHGHFRTCRVFLCMLGIYRYLGYIRYLG